MLCSRSLQQCCLQYYYLETLGGEEFTCSRYGLRGNDCSVMLPLGAAHVQSY